MLIEILVPLPWARRKNRVRPLKNLVTTVGKTVLLGLWP